MNSDKYSAGGGFFAFSTRITVLGRENQKRQCREDLNRIQNSEVLNHSRSDNLNFRIKLEFSGFDFFKFPREDKFFLIFKGFLKVFVLDNL